MNIQTLTDDTLSALHASILAAMRADDATPPGGPKPYGVREHSDWRADAEKYEAELFRGKLSFNKIDWAAV
jgi:hypothetical protein